jgi:multiple antibiotic resistance protein
MDTLKSFISLLALINPIGAIPFFISLTSQQTEAEKLRTIKTASVSVAIVVGSRRCSASRSSSSSISRWPR